MFFVSKMLCTFIPYLLNLNLLPCSQLLLCTQESENVLAASASGIGPNDNQHVWLTEDIVNNIICIPLWWHDCITGVGQQFDNIIEVRLARIYYSIAKKCIYDFVKNGKRRITVKCSKKETTGYAWKLHASLMIHTTRFVIKHFNHVHTCGGDMSIDGHNEHPGNEY